MSNVIVGMTANKLHSGHKKLLDKAFNTAGTFGGVYIGVTSDSYTAKFKKYFVPYNTRVTRIKCWIQAYNPEGNYTIKPLDDKFGDSINEIEAYYTHIVVSPETEPMAKEINVKREAIGRNPLQIIVVEPVLDEDGNIISSTRIMEGEINESGVYKRKMKVTMLGTSGGMSSTYRASAGVLVEYKGTTVLLDCGDMTSVQMQKAKVKAGDIDAIFISHSHLDHYSGLPLLVMHHMMLQGRTKDIDIYCPEEVINAVAYMFNNNKLPMPFKVNFNIMPYNTNFEGLKIISFEVDHGIPEAYGFYIINDRDKSIVYSGDTKPCCKLQNYARGSKLLIHDATFCSDWDTDPHGHTKVNEAIDIARSAEVEKLVLSHISLRYHSDMATYKNDAKSDDVNVIVAEDLDIYTV